MFDKITFTPFEVEYFIQTRKEVETEKQSRERLLQVLVLLLGAIGGVAFASSRKETMAWLATGNALLLQLPLLVLLTGVFWFRWKKLYQIANRWYALDNLLSAKISEADMNRVFERYVARGMEGNRYIVLDLVLHLCLCVPIYTWMVYSGWGWETENGSIVAHLPKLGLAALIILHFIISTFLLRRKTARPNELTSASVTTVRQKTQQKKDTDVDLSGLGFSSRVVKKLQSHRIRSLDELIHHSRDQLLSLKGVGKKTVEAIAAVLEQNGYLWPESGA